jgi:hypothetical protein
MALTLFKSTHIKIERRIAPTLARPSTAFKPSTQYNFFLVIAKTEEMTEFTEVLIAMITSLGIVKTSEESATEVRVQLDIKEAGSLLTYLRERKGLMSYDDALILTTNMASQLGQLQETTRKVVPFIVPSAVGYIIHPTTATPVFLFLSPEGLLPQNMDNTISVPFAPTGIQQAFLAPELQTITATTPLPFKVSNTAWLYSLAQLVTYCITNRLDITTPEMTKKALEPLELTKLAFALRRCIAVNPTERIFILI